MENFENGLHQQPESVLVPQEDTQSQPQVQPQAAQTQYAQQQYGPGFYHGAGVGQQETPFAQNAYAGYQPYQQPYQPPYQPPYQQPQGWNAYQMPPEPPKPPKRRKAKKSGKFMRAVLALLLVLAMVVGGCVATACICNSYWKAQNDKLLVGVKEQNNKLLQNMQEKLDALQKELEENQKSDGEGAGPLNPGQSLTAAQIYQQNVNSVVAISCTVRTTNNYGQVSEGKSAGTGFIITEDGYIVTNHHVINGATKITVSLADGTQYVCQLVGSNSTNDIAVIKAQAVGLDPVTLGSSSAMQVGDQVVAIGNALGELTSSLTVGYISGMDRDISTDGTVINMIQTDAAINSGNSGGPLFNAKGEVIGITSAKYSGTTSSGASIEGISFAIPLDDVIDMIDDLLVYGYIRSAYLGVMVWEVDAAVAATYNLPQGVYVEDVTPGYCAAAAGVQPKDIIVELGGYSVKTMNDLSRALRAYEAGETVTLVVWRAGQRVVLTVTLDAKPAQ